MPASAASEQGIWDHAGTLPRDRLAALRPARAPLGRSEGDMSWFHRHNEHGGSPPA